MSVSYGNKEAVKKWQIQAVESFFSLKLAFGDKILNVSDISVLYFYFYNIMNYIIKNVPDNT